MTKLLTLTDTHAGASAEGQFHQLKINGGVNRVTNILQSGIYRFRPDAVVDLGDLIEHSHCPAEDLANFRNALAPFSTLTIPHLHCIGNHPLMNLAESVVANELPRNGSAHPYFAQDIGDHRIIMLHSRFSYRVDTAEHQSGSGIYIDQQQLNWLKHDLATSDRGVLVCCHHPLSIHNLKGNKWFERYPECALMQNSDQVRKVIHESGKVIAVLNGHTHWNHLARDEYGTPHITQQSVSENFRSDGTPSNTYGIVTLKDAAFNLEIFGNDLALKSELTSPAQIAAQLRNTYNSIAIPYARATFQYGQQEHEQFDKLIPLLKPNHSPYILDFGCGPARDFPHYMNRGFIPIGIDCSEEFLRIARQNLPNAHLVHANFGEASLQSDMASIAIHNSTLQHVPRESLDRVLKETFDALEPGGIFYCHYRTGTGESLSISTEYGAPIARFIALYTEEEMNAALERVGFEILASDTRDHGYEGLKGKVVKDKSHSWARKPGNP